jgi:hypothetical protein
MENVFETIQLQAAHEKAMTAARNAAQDVSNQYFNGRDGGSCGFSWVNVREKVRSNSKLGKALATLGYDKNYYGQLQLWNKWYRGQSVDCGEAGARAYARVFTEETGIEVIAGSRLD